MNWIVISITIAVVTAIILISFGLIRSVKYAQYSKSNGCIIVNSCAGDDCFRDIKSCLEKYPQYSYDTSTGCVKDNACRTNCFPNFETCKAAHPIKHYCDGEKCVETDGKCPVKQTCTAGTCDGVDCNKKQYYYCDETNGCVGPVSTCPVTQCSDQCSACIRHYCQDSNCFEVKGTEICPSDQTCTTGTCDGVDCNQNQYYYCDSLYSVIKGPVSQCPIGESCSQSKKDANGSCCIAGPSTPACSLAASVNDPWIGWATTSNFVDQNNPVWPNHYDRKSIDLLKIHQGTTIKIGDKDVHVVRYPAAIPWGMVASEYDNMMSWIYDIIDSAETGQHSRAKSCNPPCFLIQQINKYPDEIKGTNDFESAKMCSNENTCTDLNSDDIAIDADGIPFPIYLLVPYTGCGGNCCNYNDCANSCKSMLQFECGFSQVPRIENPTCSGLFSQYNNNTWQWNDDVAEKYYTACGDDIPSKSDPLPDSFQQTKLAISPWTDYGRNKGQAVNYCTTQNMHFDIYPCIDEFGNVDSNCEANRDRLMMKIFKVKVTGKGETDTNVIVRYKRVPCNILETSALCGVEKDKIPWTKINPCSER